MNKEQLQNEEKRLRLQFAKVFSWYQEKQEYGFSRGEKELYNPSWEEIFVEVGKLLQNKKTKNIDDEITELRCNIGDLKEFLKFEENKIND